jgi:succinyl-diaminopimelate desuccinylase
LIDKQKLLKLLSEELILDLASKLVAIPSRNPPGEEKECAEFILRTLVGWGVETELIGKPDVNRPQVVSWLRGTGSGKTVILNGHLDTVGEGDSSQWQTSPFEAVMRGNRLFGLGVCDMKGSLAIVMAILRALSETDMRFPGTLMFQAAMGEEMAEDGTRTLLNLGYTGDYAIVLEPTDLKIAPATRGVVWHKIKLEGKPVHCGLAAAGDSDLIAQFSRIAEAISAYHGQVSTQCHPLIASPACRITQVNAGQAHNSTAGTCEFIVDRRMLPHESFEQVRKDLEHILGKAKIAHPTPDFNYQIEYMLGNEPTEIPLSSPLIEILKKNLESFGKRKLEFIGTPFGSDMRNFVHDARIPTVNFGAGDFRVCHCPNEFVPIDDLMLCARVLMATVIDILKEERN